MFGYFSLYSINPQDLFIIIAFIVSFFIFNLAFSKFLKQNKTSWVPALGLAIATSYGLWMTGFNLSILTSRINLSEQTLLWLGGILVIFLLVIFFVKSKNKRKINLLFIIIGTLFLFLSQTGFFTSTGSAIIIGIILVIFGLYPYFKKKK